MSVKILFLIIKQNKLPLSGIKVIPSWQRNIKNTLIWNDQTLVLLAEMNGQLLALPVGI